MPSTTEKIENTDILSKRYEGIIHDYNGFKVSLLKELIDEYRLILFDDYDYCIKNMIYKEGEQLEWDSDARHVSENIENSVPEPKYSMIIFESDYNDDFSGGEFQFKDKTILPKHGKFFVYDSREVYKINKITTGVCTYILVRFY